MHEFLVEMHLEGKASIQPSSQLSVWLPMVSRSLSMTPCGFGLGNKIKVTESVADKWNMDWAAQKGGRVWIWLEKIAGVVCQEDV